MGATGLRQISAPFLRVTRRSLGVKSGGRRCKHGHVVPWKPTRLCDYFETADSVIEDQPRPRLYSKFEGCEAGSCLN